MKGADGRMRGCVKGLFLLLLLALLPCVCPARDESLFVHAAREYEFDSWRGQTKAAYARVVPSFMLPRLFLPTNGWPIANKMTDRGTMYRYDVYLTNTLSTVLMIETKVFPTVVAAQESLINHFASIPIGSFHSCTNDIGDRSYAIDRPTESFTVFTRNNVYVYVGSETNAIPADLIARQIDADILRKSTEVLWGRWAVAGVVLLGLSLFIVRRRRTKPRRTGASPGKSDDTKKEKRRKPGIARVVLGVVVLLVFGAIVYSPWGRQAVERLVLDVFRRMAERSR